MHYHCGINNRAPRWTFTDPCKPEVRPGAREESASPVWLAVPAINAHNDSVYMEAWHFDTMLHIDCPRYQHIPMMQMYNVI